MPVAKSYKDLPLLSEPYPVSGRLYVNVLTKKGATKTVRWYSDAEYRKMYPEVKNEETPQSNQKEVLGFSAGPITIFKGDVEAAEEWFSRNRECRYCVWWGWYVVSTEQVPADMPDCIQPMSLSWEEVGQSNGALKDTASAIAAEKVATDLQGDYVGKIGDRLTITATVTKCVKLDTDYGTTALHTFKDADNNYYYWKTSAKCWNEGEVHSFKGTIKEQKVEKNKRINVLTRCLEVK